MINPKIQALIAGKDQEELDVIYAAYVLYRIAKDETDSKRNADVLNEASIIDWDRCKYINDTVLGSTKIKIPVHATISNESVMDIFGVNSEYISLLVKCDNEGELFKKALGVFRSTVGV